MFKVDHTYEDWDGNTTTETLWFNISKTKLTKNLHLKDQFEDLQKRLIGDGTPRELTTAEVQEMLDLVKTFMRLAYGVRTDDKHFKQGEELWDEFTETAAYDSYLFSLFQDPDKAAEFLTSVLPSDLRAEAEAEVSRRLESMNTKIEAVADADFEQSVLPTAPPVLEPSAKKFEDYSRPELLTMPQEQYDALIGTDQSKWTRDQLLVSFERKFK